jgi:hypothetical protein
MKISGTKIGAALCEGVGLNPNEVHRIILDIACDDVVLVYVEMYGTTKLLQVNWTDALKGSDYNLISARDVDVSTTNYSVKKANATNKKILSLAEKALCTDGEHHKQWYLEQIAKELGLADFEIDDLGADRGIAP